MERTQPIFARIKRKFVNMIYWPLNLKTFLKVLKVDESQHQVNLEKKEALEEKVTKLSDENKSLNVEIESYQQLIQFLTSKKSMFREKTQIVKLQITYHQEILQPHLQIFMDP